MVDATAEQGAATNLKVVDIRLVRENEVALRQVDQKSEKFLGLVESIKLRGFMGAITVREAKDERGLEFYELVDGLHRLTAARQAGLKEIPVNIRDLDDIGVLEAQVLANLHVIETKAMEFTKQLVRLMQKDPTLTEGEVARRMGKSLKWVQDRLGLVKITNEAIGKAIDDGIIPLANAYALCKLPESEQKEFADKAATMKPDQFLPEINERRKAIAEAKKQGKTAAPVTFAPVAYLQPKALMQAESEKLDVVAKVIKDCKTPAEAAQLTMKWVMNMDPGSVAAQKAKWEAREKERAELAKKRAEEQAAKKAAKDKEKAAALNTAIANSPAAAAATTPAAPAAPAAPKA